MSFFPRLCLLVLLFALPDAGAHAQSAPFTLYLAGDGGAATSVDGTPALAMLRDSLAACEASCGVLFLGDNVYTRLNSSHVAISYAVFCWKKKNAKEVDGYICTD